MSGCGRLWSAVRGECARKLSMGGTFSLVTGLPPMVCKSIAKASKVRILHLPPRVKRAPDLRRRRLEALSCGPAVIGSNRLSTAVPGNTPGSFGHIRLSACRSQRERCFDACLRDLVLAIDARGVDPEEDIHAVPGPRYGDPASWVISHGEPSVSVTMNVPPVTGTTT
jgi:hypothetical protein